MIFQEMLDDERKEGNIESIKAILEFKGIILEDNFYLQVLREQNSSQLLKILVKASAVQNVEEFMDFLRTEQIMIIKKNENI